MANVLLIGTEIPTFFLTGRDFLKYSKLVKFNYRTILVSDIKSCDLNWCDILICIRSNDPISEYVSRKALKAGKKILLLLDDDLLNNNSNDHPYIIKVRKRSLKKMLSYSSLIIANSKYLGEKYHKISGKSYVTLDTVVVKDDIVSKYEKSEPIKMLYAANKAHIQYFNKLITPILNRLYSKYKEKISLTLIGPIIQDESIKLKIEQYNLMPFDKYNGFMKNNHFDIGLAPLFDEEFEWCKYYNKYLEYSRLGILGIYSDQLPFNSVVKDGFNGLLAKGDPDNWYYAICRAIDDESLRRRCVKNAQSQILSDCSVENNAKKLVSAFPEIATFKPLSRNKVFVRFVKYRYLLFWFISGVLWRLSKKNNSK